MVIVSAIAILFAVCLIVFLIETNAVASVKPSCAVTRLTVADGRLPSRLKRSLEAAKRRQTPPATGCAPARSGVRRRGSGRSTRQTAAGSPDLITAFGPMSHGSAISFTCESTGQFFIASNSGACWLNAQACAPSLAPGRNENRRRGTFHPVFQAFIRKHA